MADNQVTSTVLAWHDALNEGDVERLISLSSSDIEVGGPRGAAHGTQVLREWVDRANITLEPGRLVHREQAVIVEQQAVWRSPESGEVIGSESVASVFVVQAGQVISVHRYPDLGTALDGAGIEETDGGSDDERSVS